MENTNENTNFNSEPASFGLPSGYFQKSANSIFNKIEWVEEHKIFPVLSSLKKESGFIVPENYFETSASNLELLDCPKLFSIKKINGFKVPVNYFEEAESALFINLTINGEDELSSFKKLNSITKQNSFKVNDDYFALTEEKLKTALTHEKRSGKIINLFSPKLYYAAAAILTITLGLWIYNQYFNVIEYKDCGTLACVDKVDLVKTKNLENLDNDQLYELVDTKKLEEKLEGKDEIKTNKTNTDKKDLDTSLKNVSTDDLLDEI